MNWTRFYTPRSVAVDMIRLLPKSFKPKNIIDLCVGSANLLHSYPQIKGLDLVGLDIDENVVSELKQNYGDFRIFNINAINYKALNHLIVKEFGDTFSFDLVLANPPFGDHKSSRFINSKYIPLELLPLFEESCKIKRIEAYMLISNLIFLKKGGYFITVLPESFFSGQKWNHFKKIFYSLFTKMKISRKMQCFEGSDVKTRVFFGKRKLKYEPIKTKENKISLTGKIEILRGSFVKVSPKKITKKFIPVFHNSDLLENKCKRKYIAPSDKKYKHCAILKKNDIIVNRIGKNCGNAIVVKMKHINWHASDCIFIVRQNLYNPILLSSYLNNKLKYHTKGLTVNYLTKDKLVYALNRFKIY